MNDSVIQLELRPFALCSLDLFRNPGLAAESRSAPDDGGVLGVRRLPQSQAGKVIEFCPPAKKSA
jgi:hypothetical protein